MQHEKIRLQRITKANFIIGYSALALVAFVIAAFIITLAAQSLTGGFAILLFGGIITGGILAAMVVASVILGAIESKIASKLGTFGGIKPKGVLAIVIVTSIVSLLGITLGIIFDAIEQLKESDLSENIISISLAIILTGCLVQAIFNTVYYVKVRGPKQKKAKTKVKKSH